MSEPHDDRSDAQIWARSQASMLKRARKDGRVIPGAEEIVDTLAEVFLEASHEPEPIAFLAEAFTDDDDEEEEPPR